MITAIDTNILLDVLKPGTPEAVSSESLLDLAGSQGDLIVYEIVYAELASQFSSSAELEESLSQKMWA